MNRRQYCLDVNEENYDEIMNVSLKGAFFFVQKIAKIMVNQKNGKIINIGSLTASYSMSQISAYTSAKAAIGQLTKSQELEFGGHNIQVNTISPGYVITRFTKKI